MANRYFVGGGTGNWNSTTNWSATDGGASGASFPVAADAVFLTALSGANLTVNVASACLTFDCTGFTGSLTLTANLQTAGNVTLGAGMTTAGTAHIFCQVAATWTSNGVQLSGTMNMSGAVVHTIADAWNVGGLSCGSSLGSGTQTTTVNGAAITVRGSYVNAQTAGGFVLGTAEFIFAGTGSISGVSAVTAVTRNPITINTAGTITLTTNFRYNTGTLTHIAGTIAGNFTLICSAATTLDVGGAMWFNVTLDGAVTYTLLSDLLMSNALSLGATGGTQTINGVFNIVPGGSVSLINVTTSILGQAILKLTNTQTVTKSAGVGVLFNSIIIDAPGKTVTFVGTDFRLALNQMLCLAGTVVTPGGTWTTLTPGSGSAQTSYAEIL